MSRAEILLEAALLDDGTSVRVVCPTCGGGSSRERSLSISKDGGSVLWNCHRASCTEKGGSGNGASYFVRTKQEGSDAAPEPRFAPYEGLLEPLSEEWIKYLDGSIGLDEELLALGRVRFSPEQHRVAYPILGPLGHRRGWVFRSYSPGERTKALTHMEKEEPRLAWCRRENNDSCVVVEDIPSALRASRYADAVALCGTGCNDEAAEGIAAHYDHVVWALDADATSEAIRLCRQHSLRFSTSRVLMIDKDLKDMEEEELCTNLTELGSE